MSASIKQMIYKSSTYLTDTPKVFFLEETQEANLALRRLKPPLWGVTLDNVLIIILKSYMILQKYHLPFALRVQN